MSHTKFFKNLTKKSVPIAGGKGASLGEMTKAKIPVPPGFVVLAGAFDRFLKETQLEEEIIARLKEVKTDDTNSVKKTSETIRDAIHDRPFPKDLEKEILEAFDALEKLTVIPAKAGIQSQKRNAGSPIKSGMTSKMFVAVRSSATAEDSAIASWAGELETYLNIERKNVVVAVRTCWSSLFTPRAIFYRHEKKLIDHYVSVAVVVQKMVQSEISGIAFTVHPVTEDRDQMIIEAGFGLGEAIVSGQVTPDGYVVSKSEMSIIDINVASQTKKLVRSRVKSQKSKVKFKIKNDDSERSNANQWVKLSAHEGDKQKLSGKQIIELAKICANIEKHYKFPCDIEWAYEGGKFYITQSRPITTLKK